MKLFELSAHKPSKQAAKVFESYFGDTINIDVISPKQARTMLTKVRKLVNEHRQTREFHFSEQNPTYLKLMMMERVLATKVKETSTVPVGAAAGADKNVESQQNKMAMPNPTVAVGQMNDQQKRQAQASNASNPQLVKTDRQMTDGAKIKMNPMAAAAIQEEDDYVKKSLTIDEQKYLAKVALQTESIKLRHSLYHILRESEVQQAQVVLAAQDMVDNVQKMLEQVTSMQFKDLPALVDQIKNQIGVDQAMQFNTDATAALAGLVQNLQQSKQQMDAALGTVTGQTAPTIPGMDDDGMGGEIPDETMPGEEGMAPGIEEPEEPEAPEMGGAGLGRAKR
jgi:hypothetical protein